MNQGFFLLLYVETVFLFSVFLLQEITSEKNFVTASALPLYSCNLRGRAVLKYEMDFSSSS